MGGPGCGSACQDCHCVTLQEQRTETFLDESVDGVGQTFRSTAEAGPGGLGAPGMSTISSSNPPPGKGGIGLAKVAPTRLRSRGTSAEGDDPVSTGSAVRTEGTGDGEWYRD